MINYKEYEKLVFDWLFKKHQQDPSFTFSLRRKGSKGAELDYFIGTTASKYFGTTFWNIPVGYPGSSSDLFDLFFSYTKEKNLIYYFEVVQTRTPTGEQNIVALEFVKHLKSIFKKEVLHCIESPSTNKMEWGKIFGKKITGYKNIQDLFSDLEQDLNKIIPIIDNALVEFKEKYPSFTGHRIKDTEFNEFLEKKDKRVEKYKGEPDLIDTDADKEDIADNKSIEVIDKMALNQILFGPPGTGKTYNTIDNALQIINEAEEKILDWEDRKKVKEQFDKRIAEGKIVFTTFHQSMSYEDFIEGIKPIEPKVEGQAINYKVIDGIFKKACAIASYNSYKLFNNSKKQPNTYSFDDLYQAFTESIQKEINKENPPVYKTLRGREVEVKEINSNNSIIARAKNSVASSSAPLTKENIQKLYDKFKTIEEIEDLKQVQETVQITPRITEFYAVFSGLKQFERLYEPDKQLIIESNEIDSLDFEEIQKKFNAGVYKDATKSFSKTASKVVLIIDEINRGNVSQIFGELITLIEDDKRIGKEEALEVTLPYSKEKFGVPANLYIIGTMNTADRSVEALDAALRRRFCFEEMPPRPELIATKGKLKDGVLEGIDLVELLSVINKRIEKLIDKDHQIGHSYFMSVENLDDLKVAFQNKIIPLLQEYFFGDYGKIGLVLGEGFFEKPENELNTNVFSNFFGYSADELAERPIFRLKDITKLPDDEFISAVLLQMKK